MGENLGDQSSNPNKEKTLDDLFPLPKPGWEKLPDIYVGGEVADIRGIVEVHASSPKHHHYQENDRSQ